MRKIFILTIMALAMVAVIARAESTQYGVELRGSLNYWVPNFDLYDFAYGVDVEYRNWFWDPVGFALGMGVSSWEIKDGSWAVDKSVIRDIDGQLTTIPVGPSIVYKIVDMSDWNLTAEAGVRYVFAQSAIDYKRTGTGGSGKFDIDNGVIGIFGLDYERYFDDGKSFFVGAGYQMDIDEGAIQISDITSTSDKLEAFSVRIGTKIQF